MAAFVVLLVVVWGVGFLWFRGDLGNGKDAKPTAKSPANERTKPGRDAECQRVGGP